MRPPCCFTISWTLQHQQQYVFSLLFREWHSAVSADLVTDTAHSHLFEHGSLSRFGVLVGGAVNAECVLRRRAEQPTHTHSDCAWSDAVI